MKSRQLAALFFAIIFCSGVALARPPMSAKREAGESYHEAVNRSRARVMSFQQPRFGTSAYDVRVKRFDDIDLSRVQDIGSAEKLQQVFESYRDKRYIADPEDVLFLRRISWMFPDDGCFARAELLGRLSEHDVNPAISKLFVFGDLRAKTPNHPQGEVQWWYHVAAAYRLGNELYVLDPSVESKKAITDQEWGQRVGDQGVNGETTLEWSICATHAIDPGVDCLNPPVESEENMKSWLAPYLLAERARAVELGRVANEVLGESPPWRNVPEPEAPLPTP